MGSDGDNRDLVKLLEQGPEEVIRPVGAVRPSREELTGAFRIFVCARKPKPTEFRVAVRLWDQARRRSQVLTTRELAEREPGLLDDLKAVFAECGRRRSRRAQASRK